MFGLPNFQPARMSGDLVSGIISGLGFNTGVLTAVAPNRPFLNLAKQSNNWVADNAASFTANADGYPTAMENSATYYESNINLNAEETSFRTVWRVTWDGDGTIRAGTNANSEVIVGSNEIEFTPATVTNNLKIYWKITDFGTTGVSNVAVVRKDRAALYDAGERYEPVWLTRLSYGGQTRFLNWLPINSSNTAPTLAGRTTLTSYRWTRLPIEIAVDVCNQSKSDLWYLFNHQAPQDLVEFVAGYIRDNLDSSLKTIVEFTNEPWNSAFGQTEYYYARGLEYFRGTAMAGTMFTTQGSNVVTGSGTSFTTELANNTLVGIDGQFFIVDTVDSDTQFTADSGRTATKTGSGFDGYYGSEYDHHDAYVYESSIKRDWFHAVHSTNVEFHLNAQYSVSTGVSRLIDADQWAASTPSGGVAWTARNLKWDRIGLGLYFGGGIINDAAKVNALQALLDVSDDAGVSALIDTYLRAEGETGALPDIIDKLRGHDVVCKAAGIALDVYEEGPHISHSTGSSTGAQEQTMLEAQQVWRKSAECTSFMSDFLDVHKAFVNGRYNHFDLHHAPSGSGDWGAWRLLDDPDAATDKMSEFLLTIPSESVWYGDDVAPIAIGSLPAITEDEFDTIATIKTDVLFSANTTSYSASGLPDGLSISTTTGDITGTLSGTSSGAGTYSVTATNAAGSTTGAGSYTITNVDLADPSQAAYDGVAWIDLTDATSLTLSGSDITAITDKIGGDVHASPSGKEPTNADLVINGENLGRFYNQYTSGSTDTTVNTIPQAFTLYFLYDGGTAGGGGRHAFMYGGTNAMFSLAFPSGGDATFSLTTVDDGATSVTVTPVAGEFATRLVTVKYDGTNLTIDVNGTSASQAATGDIDWGGTPSAFCRVGSGSGTNYIRGHIGELFICDRAHTPTEVTAMQGYFNTKYGL